MCGTSFSRSWRRSLSYWVGNPKDPWGLHTPCTSSWPWPWPFSPCGGGGAPEGGPEVDGFQVNPKEYLEMRIKPLWQITLKSCSFAASHRLREKQKTEKGISYLNLTTYKSLWSTFLLVLQGKIIFPSGIKRQTTSVVWKTKNDVFYQLQTCPRAFSHTVLNNRRLFNWISLRVAYAGRHYASILL